VAARLALALALVAGANAQEIIIEGPVGWPSVFTGGTSMGPYQWIPAGAITPASNLVAGGSEGTISMYVCRAALSDGVHPGKYFNRQCNIGWGGTEVVKKDGFEVLVNTRHDLAAYLSQNWVSPSTAMQATFTGGNAGAAAMRVCRAAYIGGWHPGKEWGGKCNIGYGGKEVAEGVYQVLSLGWDRNAFLASNGPKPFTIPAPTPVQVATIVSVQNGLWMRDQRDGYCVGVTSVHAPATPKVAIADVNEDFLARVTAVGYTAREADCVEHPKNWFVTDAMGSGWFRIRYFQTNYCLVPGRPIAALDDSRSVDLAVCDGSRAQWWRVGPGSTLLSGLTDDELVRKSEAAEAYGEVRVCKTLDMYVLDTNARVVLSKPKPGYARPDGSPYCAGILLTMTRAANWKYNEDKQGRILH
jgi:hypothetical protein